MSRFPLRPFLVPAIVAVITGWALVAALLSDGPVEGLAVAALALVVGLVIWKLVDGSLARRRRRTGPPTPP